MNDQLTFLARLRATKEFLSDAVSDDAVAGILEVGRWSASGVNRQPCEVVVVRDAAVREQFGAWGAKPAASAPVVLLICVAENWSALDEGRMAERLCLAALASGLGSTVATLKAEGPEAVKGLLGIPASYRSATVVAIGVPDRVAAQGRPKRPVPRKPLAEYAHFDRF